MCLPEFDWMMLQKRVLTLFFFHCFSHKPSAKWWISVFPKISRDQPQLVGFTTSRCVVKIISCFVMYACPRVMLNNAPQLPLVLIPNLNCNLKKHIQTWQLHCTYGFVHSYLVFYCQKPTKTPLLSPQLSSSCMGYLYSPHVLNLKWLSYSRCCVWLKGLHHGHSHLVFSALRNK